MLDLKQTDRMLKKLERFVDIIEPMIFEKVGETGPVSAFATLERFHSIPENSRISRAMRELFGWTACPTATSARR